MIYKFQLLFNQNNINIRRTSKTDATEVQIAKIFVVLTTSHCNFDCRRHTLKVVAFELIFKTQITIYVI